MQKTLRRIRIGQMTPIWPKVEGYNEEGRINREERKGKKGRERKEGEGWKRRRRKGKDKKEVIEREEK